MADKRMNFVFIITDSQRNDMVGAYGNPKMDTDEFYDLQADPGAMVHLIDEPSTADVHDRLHDAIWRRWLAVVSRFGFRCGVSARGGKLVKFLLGRHKLQSPGMLSI